ncbi:thioredoxin-like fold [Anaeramoeba ignava]|uniref:thioredoxin-dependent peroxiredoxin n=1 Tax=Anaeramoeba ignava TaxID=1746090 RepID=A0A9Q0LBD2_ANAIG|nr:thioredoxin-like fold [Anaeramoeba ignava]
MATVLKPAPDFKAPTVFNMTFEDMTLKDLYGGKQWLVFFFYPADFTFVCPTELIAFSDSIELFHKIDCNVAACSTDTVYTHFAWISQPRKEGGLGEMKIPIVADHNLKISKDYGVLIEDGTALRGLFIIDPKGIVRHITINDQPIGRSVNETLRVVKALQHFEKHGEVCAVNWQEGDDTIKPDPIGAKEYFSKHN